MVAKGPDRFLFINQNHEDLYLSLNIDNGAKLQLSDGSTFLIDPKDRIYSSYWITPFPIRLSSSNDSDFPVKITNLTSGTSVNGMRISKEALLQEEIKKAKKRKEEALKHRQTNPPLPEQQVETTPQVKKPSNKKQSTQKSMKKDNQ